MTFRLDRRDADRLTTAESINQKQLNNGTSEMRLGKGVLCELKPLGCPNPSRRLPSGTLAGASIGWSNQQSNRAILGSRNS